MEKQETEVKVVHLSSDKCVLEFQRVGEFLHRESLRAFSSLKMQAATKAARRLSQVMGLGNGTTSAYISATWGREPEPFDEALIPDSHSIPEVGPLSPSTAFFPSSSSRTIGQRIFMFFGVDPNANENFFRDQGEVDRALSSEPKELVSRMKRKMTTFLAITSSSESPEGSITAAESSDAAEKIIDLPSFNRSGDRKRPKQGAVKPTSYSRKRGAAISSQHQVQLLSTLQRISITFFYFSGGPLRIRAYCGSWGTRADAAWTACGSWFLYNGVLKVLVVQEAWPHAEAEQKTYPTVSKIYSLMSIEEGPDMLDL
ncbi:hypothetical protein R1flu_008618 [Riccia fluitans]|uniref:Uncharacterized protein n=1 Tax=Riccia fluitans TaxID=41844 RepID=A0ABD1YC96_9MARC